MNWQTEELFKRARQSINDEGVFSPDQILKLEDMIDLIKAAISKESDCIGSSINHTM